MDLLHVTKVFDKENAQKFLEFIATDISKAKLSHTSKKIPSSETGYSYIGGGTGNVVAHIDNTIAKRVANINDILRNEQEQAEKIVFIKKT